MRKAERVKVTDFVSRLLGRKGPSIDPVQARMQLQTAQPGLVIHLGDFKTGTTAVQTWLSRHGATAGIALAPGFNQAALAQSLTNTEPKVAEQAFAALAGQLSAYSTRHAVISAEHFEMVDPLRLAAMLARYLPDWQDGLRLIAYVRPHPPAYLARFAESTKIGSHDGDIDRYLDLPHIRRRLTYAPRFTAWRNVFGERFTLRLYDRSVLKGGDVTRDFLAFVTGRDPGPLDITANPTPGLADLALARALHRAIGPLPAGAEDARWTLGRHLGRQLAAAQITSHTASDNRPLHLHRALAKRLVDAFTADARALDAAFFTGNPLEDALGTAIEGADPLPPSLAPEDHFSAQTLAVIALWGGMLRDGLITPEGAALIDRIYHE